GAGDEHGLARCVPHPRPLRSETRSDRGSPNRISELIHRKYTRRMLIETHAHLDYPDFAPDFDDVLRRANEAGVTRMITIGTSLESSRRAIELAEKYPQIYAVIGVHPTADDSPDDVMTPLRELAKNPRVVAIGETGLDYHRLPSAMVAKERHMQVFASALRSEMEEETEATIHDGAYKSKQ